MTDYGSSPDLPDVRQVGRAFLRSWPSPDLPDVQRVGLVSKAFAQPKLVWLSGLAELLAISFPNQFNK